MGTRQVHGIGSKAKSQSQIPKSNTTEVDFIHPSSIVYTIMFTYSPRSARALLAAYSKVGCNQPARVAYGAHTLSLFCNLNNNQYQQYHEPHAHNIQQRNFANKKIIDIRRNEQRATWSSYLTGSISPNELFIEIDLNKSGYISVDEINYFLDSVERSGVNPAKFELLQQLGNDHQLDTKEFKRWLRVATDVTNDGGELSSVKDDDSSSSSDSSDDDDDDDDQAAAESRKPLTPLQKAFPTKKKVIDVRHGLQSMAWEYFLTTGTHATDLFKMIDLNRSNSISVGEISYFIDSIGGRGVSYGKLSELRSSGADHELSEQEFYAWLTDATGVEIKNEEEEHSIGAMGDGESCTPGQW